jgi:hypothetical protein
MAAGRHGRFRGDERTGGARLVRSCIEQACCCHVLLGADLVGPDDSMRILARGDEWFASITDQGDSPEPPH